MILSGATVVNENFVKLDDVVKAIKLKGNQLVLQYLGLIVIPFELVPVDLREKIESVAHLGLAEVISQFNAWFWVITDEFLDWYVFEQIIIDFLAHLLFLLMVRQTLVENLEFREVFEVGHHVSFLDFSAAHAFGTHLWLNSRLYLAL